MKSYESGRRNLDLSPALFQRASRRFMRKYMRRKNRKELSQTTDPTDNGSIEWRFVGNEAESC